MFNGDSHKDSLLVEGLVFSVWTPAQGPGWSSGLSDLLDICLVPIGDQPLFNVMETAVNKANFPFLIEFRF